MACPTRIDDNSYQNVWKNAGKATMTSKVVVSDHDKTLTVTQTPADPAARAPSRSTTASSRAVSRLPAFQRPSMAMVGRRVGGPARLACSASPSMIQCS